MKRLSQLLIYIPILFILTSCSNETDNNGVIQNAKPVKTVTVKTETKPMKLSYIGTVNYNELKKLGFKSSGKISNIYVKKGQQIKKGDTLAKLDTKDLTFAYNASKSKLASAKSQLTKAQDAYNFASDTHNRIKNMYEKNSVSKQKYEEAKLQLDLRKSELSQANDLKNQAQVDFDHKQSLLKDATLKASSDGIVVNTLFSQGEIVGAGYPVIVVRNNKKIVNVGITQEDVVKINLGDNATVISGDTKVNGTVTNISDLPDEKTRTYNIELALEDNNFKIGFIVDVDIVIGKEEGIWIPIKAIKSNGHDYVFIAKNNIAHKKTVKIISTNETNAKINGLNNNDAIIIEGIKSLIDGNKITIDSK
ncbi:efflux RND transporter periplasmic adaptor subunit [Clostridiaceae bacterium M8S5]|nr:efflux RND transporter periplasmic adaptor subunit [Clostridiaceae bacterium M8S5]